MTIVANASNLSTAQLAEAIKLLKEKSKSLSIRTPISEIVQNKVNSQWSHIETSRIQEFRGKLSKTRALIYLEFAILESIRGQVSDDVLDKVKDTFIKVRESNDLRNTLAIFYKVKGDVKTRQLLKLVNAVYRYNRTLLNGSGKSQDFYAAKSRIKHATACPHCGETAKLVLGIMSATESVKLPTNIKLKKAE